MAEEEYSSEDMPNATGNLTYEFLGSIANFNVPINGYCVPIITLVTMITNVLICVTLLKKNMRTPTNMILLSMALADLMTGVFPLPVNVYFFTMGNYEEWLPYNWCYAVNVIYKVLPMMSHTASIWLTVGLGVQRYVYICKSIDAKRVCSLKRILICIGAIFVLAFLMHVTVIFSVSYKEATVVSRVDPSRLVSACVEVLQDWDMDKYFAVYFCLRVICVHIIPCFSLVVLNSLLVYTMRVAQARRRCLLLQNRKTEWKRIQDSNCTTLMLVTVVTMFLLVEIPLGIVMTLVVVQNTGLQHIFAKETQEIISTFLNLFIHLSYPLNFVIYCSMSRQFRKTFMGLFFRGRYENNYNTHYLSVAQESNGNFKNGHNATTATLL